MYLYTYHNGVDGKDYYNDRGASGGEKGKHWWLAGGWACDGVDCGVKIKVTRRLVIYVFISVAERQFDQQQ